MDIFKRIGTTRHKFRVEIIVDRLVLAKSLKGTIYVSCKRGSNKLKTPSVAPAAKKLFSFNDCSLLFDSVTLFHEDEACIYQQKLAEIKVILLSDDQEKKILGHLTIDFGDYANQKEQSYRLALPLEEAPSKLQPVLHLQLILTHMGDASETDTKSLCKDQKEPSSLDKFKSFFGFGSEKQLSPKKEAFQEANKQTQKPTKKPKPFVIDNEPSEIVEAEIDSARKKQKGKEVTLQDLKIDLFEHCTEDATAVKKKRKKEKKQSLPQQSDEEPPSQIEKPPTTRQNNHVSKKEEPVRKQKQTFLQAKPQNNSPALSPEENTDPPIDSSSLGNCRQVVFTTGNSYKPEPNEPKFDDQAEEIAMLQNKIKDLQCQNERLTDDLSSSKAAIKALQVKYDDLKRTNERISNENTQLRKGDRETIAAVHRPANELQEQIKVLEREKNEQMVAVSREKQKYKKEMRKYEEKLAAAKEQLLEHTEASKSELQRLKDECLKEREQKSKTQMELSEKVRESKAILKENTSLNGSMSVLKERLAKIKIRIGDRLNEANGSSETEMIQLLTSLLVGL